MPHSPERRRFLASTLAGAAAGAAAFIPQVGHAIEPITRTEGHRYKFSVAAFSYRNLLSNGSLTLIEFMDDCAKFGVEGTELTSYYFPDPPTEEFLRNLKAEAFRRGLDVSGTAIKNNFCLPPGEARNAEIAQVKRWIEYADMLDAPVIRIYAGTAQLGQSKEDAMRLAIEGIDECCDHAGKYGVFLALENVGGLTGQVDDMVEIIRGVKSKYFGVNMDTGDYRSADPYADLAKLAPYTINVQVKVVMRFAGQGAQPTDFARLSQMLKDVGYRGYLALEFEEAGDPREECGKYIQIMREAFV